MAKYYFEAGLVGRGAKHKSKSAIAKAAYNSRESLHDERTGKTYSWSRLGEAEFTGIFLPKQAPAEWHKLNEQDKLRQTLWQELENHEDRNRRRDTALLSRTFIIGIPEEFDTAEKRERFVIDYGRQLSRQGWIADLCVHPPETDKRNYHIHAQLPLREVDQDGFSKRINLWGKEAGIKRDMSHDEELASQKEMFLKLAARHLRRYGHELEADRFLVSHLTLDKQKADAERRGDWSRAKELDREPTVHMGREAWAMEKDGVRTRKGDQNREINQRNYARQNGHPIPPRVPNQAERMARTALGFVANGRVIGKTLDAVAGIVDGAFAPILTPEQKHAGEKADREKAAAAAQAQRARDWTAETAEEKRQREARRSTDRER